MNDDATLLARYAEAGSEEAFRELVQRHLSLVYSAALRRLDGDVHRARDVAQIVFTALARDAAKLRGHPALAGWLYVATRSAAIDLLRSERRRRIREMKAHAADEILASPESAPDWEQLRPVLDEAMDELEPSDREAVLLRFFAGSSLAAVGEGLRVSEDTARKRVDRALDKLGAQLARRGITSTGGALAVLLANQTSIAAPVGAAASIATAALAGASAAGVLASGAGAAGIFIMTTSKAVTGIAALVALAAIGTAVYQAKWATEVTAQVATLSTERDALRAKLGSTEKRAQEVAAALAATQQEAATLRAAAARPADAPPAPAAPSQGSVMDYVLDHPETHAAYIEELGLRAKVRYDRFLQARGLSAEQQDRFLKTLKEVREGELDLMVALRHQGIGVGNLPKDPQTQAEMQRYANEQKQRYASELRATLGDEGFKAFQQFSAGIPDRNVADQIASQLYFTGEPLTAGQADQLTQILAQNRFTPQPTPSPANTMNGTAITPELFLRGVGQAMQQNGMSMLDWASPVTDGAIARAAGVLSPAQLAALRTVQAQQVAKFQLAPPPPAGSPSAAKLSGEK